jgi:predicted nucleic acid-binding protein
MSDPFVDTNLFVRFVAKDDPAKLTATAALFQQVEAGTVTLRAPDTVIADAVYVLCSPNIYNLSRLHVRNELAALLELPHLRAHNRRILLRALDIFAVSPRLDFGDAMIVATMERRQANTVYSYDRDFDRVPGVNRQEP